MNKQIKSWLIIIQKNTFLCDGTANLDKHGSDSASNPQIVPLVAYIFG